MRAIDGTGPSPEQNGNLSVDNVDTTSDQSQFVDWKKTAALFLSGQAISLFGSSLVQYAIIWHITLSTRSGAMMTISSIAGFLPQILISLFAGVWADRYSRKTLIVGADSLIAVSTFVMAVVFLSGFKPLWLIFLVTGIRSLGAGIQTPAVAAILPQMVPQDKLTRVNGINGSIQSAVMLLSPAASGALLSFAKLETIFFIDVATAIVAVSILLTLPISMHRRAAETHGDGQIDLLKAGIRYASEHVFVRSLLVFYALFFWLLTPVAFLTPLMIARSFGEEVWRLTANEMAFFGGSISGGVLFTLWGGFKNRIHTLALACTAFGLLNVGLGFARAFPIYLAFMFISGLGLPFFNNPVTVLLQEKVDQDMLGRVFSMVQIVASSFMPMGMLIFGPLAEVVRVEVLLIVTGVLMAILGVSIVYNKGLHR